MQIIRVVVTVAMGVILFEVLPEKSVWSIPVKQPDEHIIAVRPHEDHFITHAKTRKRT